MASGIAWRLHRGGFKNIVMLETAAPMAVRRTVSFCECVYDGTKVVDGVTAIHVATASEIDEVLSQGRIGVVTDPKWRTIEERRPDVVIDAIIAKKNLGTRMDEADLVIGLGPGFCAGRDAHAVIETNRGPNAGRVLYQGCPEENTGIPGSVLGIDVDRVVRAPATGKFSPAVQLDDRVKAGDLLGTVNGVPVSARIDGTVRGLIRAEIFVKEGVKIGDIEPRDNVDNSLVSDKSLGLGGAVLEAMLSKYNV